MRYLNVREAALKCGISPRRIQQLCKNNEIDGAKMEGRSWLIPEQAALDVRRKTAVRSGKLPE